MPVGAVTVIDGLNEELAYRLGEGLRKPRKARGEETCSLL